MTVAVPLLTRRALALFKIESTYGTDPTPVAADDAILVMDPQFTADINVLERDFVRDDLSPLGIFTGRKLASISFGVEFRSNGVANSGLVADAAKLGTLMRACGYSETARPTGIGTVDAVIDEEGNTNNPTWVVATGTTQTQPIFYTIEVTTGGVSGVAEVSITPDAQAVADTLDTAQSGVIVTTATPLDLKNGGSDASITPTFAGSLVLGEKWYVSVYPEGLTYNPVSSAFESGTLYLYLDGLLHKLTGAYGTFTVTAEAGAYATAQFTFTGIYNAPTDVAFPTGAVFEQQLPAQVELAKLRMDDTYIIVAAYNYDQANTIVPRPDVSSSEGYVGLRITGRNPSGGIDPEAELVADFDFWGKLSAATQMRFNMRVGTAAGNIIWVQAPKVQYDGLTYGDREGIRTYDAGLRFGRWKGNDEMLFHFY